MTCKLYLLVLLLRRSYKVLSRKTKRGKERFKETASRTKCIKIKKKMHFKDDHWLLVVATGLINRRCVLGVCGLFLPVLWGGVFTLLSDGECSVWVQLTDGHRWRISLRFGWKKKKKRIRLTDWCLTVRVQIQDARHDAVKLHSLWAYSCVSSKVLLVKHRTEPWCVSTTGSKLM